MTTRATTYSGKAGETHVDERTRDQTRNSEAAEDVERIAETSETTETCPECDGSLVSDEARGERVCEACGLVVDADSIDRGPEWRAFDAGEKDEKSRVGAPTTTMMHDKGLSTTIGWANRDANGNTLDASQRTRMSRLRTWDERFRTRNHKERNLKQALGEIDRMGSALGLGESVRETASVIYRRALDEDLLPGRSIEGVASASVYGAARQAGTPRTIDEVVTVSRIDETEFKRTYRYIVRELGLEVAPADPESYVARFASDLDLTDETELRARDLLQTGKHEGVHVGKSPVGLAAAAVYAAAKLTGEEVTQSDVSAVTDMSEVTIRNRYQELLEAEGEARPA
ncbi:MAG: TFIIB-type zinc ribbon-containing protein [Haloarculaceae archaeon]